MQPLYNRVTELELLSFTENDIACGSNLKSEFALCSWCLLQMFGFSIFQFYTVFTITCMVELVSFFMENNVLYLCCIFEVTTSFIL
jgi:hypothetical protein